MFLLLHSFSRRWLTTSDLISESHIMSISPWGRFSRDPTSQETTALRHCVQQSQEWVLRLLPSGSQGVGIAASVWVWVGECDMLTVLLQPTDTLLTQPRPTLTCHTLLVWKECAASNIEWVRQWQRLFSGQRPCCV